MRKKCVESISNTKFHKNDQLWFSKIEKLLCSISHSCWRRWEIRCSLLTIRLEKTTNMFNLHKWDKNRGRASPLLLLGYHISNEIRKSYVTTRKKDTGLCLQNDKIWNQARGSRYWSSLMFVFLYHKSNARDHQ